MFLAAIAGASEAAGDERPDDERPREEPPPPSWQKFVDLSSVLSSVDSPEPVGRGDGTDGLLSDDASADGDEPDAKRRRLAYGKTEDRWAARCGIAAIQADQAAGCACGCVRGLSIDDIELQRKKRSDEEDEGRRKYIREYFEHNSAPDAKCGFNLHTVDGRTLCTRGFCVYHGFEPGFFYSHRKKFIDGDRADDPNYGGNRKGKGAAADAFADDSPEMMAFIGWFKELREDTECMPNSRLRQIDYIQDKELFAECKSDLVDAGTADNKIGPQVRSHMPSLICFPNADFLCACACVDNMGHHVLH